jgi:hypothetical protein
LKGFSAYLLSKITIDLAKFCQFKVKHFLNTLKAVKNTKRSNFDSKGRSLYLKGRVWLNFVVGHISLHFTSLMHKIRWVFSLVEGNSWQIVYKSKSFL